VLFEMISGRPPFHGENHIDLLRNIQRQAVRLPPDVQISKECITLLRSLLNRNPLSRAGFQAFSSAADAFIALGCHGPEPPPEAKVATTTVGDTATNLSLRDNGIQETLGTIQENDGYSSISASDMPAPPKNVVVTMHTDPSPVVTPTLHSLPAPNIQGALPRHEHFSYQRGYPTHLGSNHTLAPLVPSPPNTSLSPLMHTATVADANAFASARGNVQCTHKMMETPTHDVHIGEQTERASMSHSQDEGSFVMVEYAAVSPGTSTQATTPGLTSIGNKDQLQEVSSQQQGRGDYLLVKSSRRGILSTSPGTGGALMGLLSGARPLLRRSFGSRGSTGNDNGPPTSTTTIFKGIQAIPNIPAAAKVLSTAEDVGRRAVSVAHLGDHRALYAMRLLYRMSNPNEEPQQDHWSSPLVSVSATKGNDSEYHRHSEHLQSCGESGAVTDDSSTTEVTSARRRDSIPDPIDGDVDEPEEMPFAMCTGSIHVIGASVAAMHSRMVVGSSHSSNQRDSTHDTARNDRPTPTQIRSCIGEALQCYLKSLTMLKGAVSAVEQVNKDLNSSTADLDQISVASTQAGQVEQMRQRSAITAQWLGSQFRGVLERADAANMELGKVRDVCLSSDTSLGMHDNPTPPSTTLSGSLPPASVEELMYKNSLAFGRDGAVKQLLGQYDAARACYRTAGLLAETLLMEPNLAPRDRSTLEEYVDGFSTRITELDAILLQESHIHAMSGSVHSSSIRRGSGGLVSRIGLSDVNVR
jgi:hypothetical protein